MSELTSILNKLFLGMKHHVLRLMIGATYWVAVVPIGLLLQIIGTDFMRCNIYRNRETTYRINRSGPRFEMKLFIKR